MQWRVGRMNGERRLGEAREHSSKGSATAFTFMWDLKQVRAQEQGRPVNSQHQLVLLCHLSVNCASRCTPGVKQDKERECCR